MEKNTKGWVAGLISSLLIAPALYRLTTNVAECVEHDSRQTKSGLVSMVWLVVLAMPLLIVAWICVSGIVLLWLLAWMNLVPALTLMFIGHLLLLLNILILFSKARDRLGFTNTRNFFRHF